MFALVHHWQVGNFMNTARGIFHFFQFLNEQGSPRSTISTQ